MALPRRNVNTPLIFVIFFLLCHLEPNAGKGGGGGHGGEGGGHGGEGGGHGGEEGGGHGGDGGGGDGSGGGGARGRDPSNSPGGPRSGAPYPHTIYSYCCAKPNLPAPPNCTSGCFAIYSQDGQCPTWANGCPKCAGRPCNS